MQIDMHYHGTYTLARAAGIGQEAAQEIATAAQFVDDNVAQAHVDFQDGARIDTEATVHHLLDRDNLDEHDQRRVWVPFHFLPGNIGDSYTERLKCRIDSEIAREMRDHHLALSDRDFALQLLGITAHVYADTFSHYGFSGVSSRGNKVNNDSFRYHENVEGLDNPVEDLLPRMEDYVKQKAQSFFDRRGEHGGLLANIKASAMGWAAEQFSGALGHGSVATLPDRPYLVWSFDYERPDAVAEIRNARNNPSDYLACCRALHDMFRQFADRRPDVFDGGGLEFDAVAPSVEGILRTQAEKAGRIEAWETAARAGAVLGGGGEEIPDYEGENWNRQWEELNGAEDFRHALGMSIWRFYQAASLHRTYVLRDLLPKHGLIVD